MTHWLNIIGVAETGVETLPPDLANLLIMAKIVIGPKRFLQELPPRKGQKKQFWKSGTKPMIEQVESCRGTPTVILATGDPNWFGIGVTLTPHLKPSEFAIHPAPSAFQLAAARMHWPLQNIVTLSLHGRPAQNLHQHILPGNRILALTSNAIMLDKIASILMARGYGKSMLTVMENIGSQKERQFVFTASEADRQTIGDFYTLAIDCIADLDAHLWPAIPGLPDEAFINDGQLTKRQVRAATLAALAPIPGALLWDVGAGCGSVGIEWMRAAPNAKAICFERNANRAATIDQNASSLGVPGLKTIIGSAPDCLADQPSPDAIFIGGAVADEHLFEICWKALVPGGRLVANAVTLAGATALQVRQKQFGGELITIAISTLTSIGKQAILKPRLPVTQWIIRKPQA